MTEKLLKAALNPNQSIHSNDIIHVITAQQHTRKRITDDISTVSLPLVAFIWLLLIVPTKSNVIQQLLCVYIIKSSGRREGIGLA